MRFFLKAIKLPISFITVFMLVFWPVLKDSYANLFGYSFNAEGGKVSLDNIGNVEESASDKYSLKQEDDKTWTEEGQANLNLELENDKRKDDAKKPTNEYYLSLEEILAVSRISIKDKITSLSILKKLPKTDVEEIVGYANEGITFDEAEKIRDILRRQLNEKDIQCLNEIVARNKRLYSQNNNEKK